jgi:hypothetical protein
MFEQHASISNQGISAQCNPCPSSVPIQSEVPRELDRLSTAICQLRDKLEMTYKRLSPILENIPVCSGQDKCVDQAVNTQIGKMIRDKSIEVETITNAVEEMYSRIGV